MASKGSCIQALVPKAVMLKVGCWEVIGSESIDGIIAEWTIGKWWQLWEVGLSWREWGPKGYATGDNTSPFLSTSCLPWSNQFCSTTPSPPLPHHRPTVMGTRNYGLKPLKPWAQINLSFKKNLHTWATRRGLVPFCKIILISNSSLVRIYWGPPAQLVDELCLWRWPRHV